MTIGVEVFMKAVADALFPKNPSFRTTIPNGRHSFLDIVREHPELGIRSFLRENAVFTVRKGQFTVEGGLQPGVTLSSGRSDRIAGVSVQLDHKGKRPLVFREADAAQAFPNRKHRGRYMLKVRNIDE